MVIYNNIMATITQLTGKVKWFNNKAGFGFITVCDEGEMSNKDIFVHYSSIQVQNAQYKYLVQGEYVDFSLSKPASGDHEFHAVNVCGIKGGSLMCETRKQNVSARPARDAVPAVGNDVVESKETIAREVSNNVRKRPSRRILKALSTDIATKEAVPTSDEEGFQKVSYRRNVPKAEPKTPRTSSRKPSSSVATTTM